MTGRYAALVQRGKGASGKVLKVGHMTTAQLILPQLPDNLESLHKEEERIRTNALLAINGDTALMDHMNMIHASMDVIHTFTNEYQKWTDDDLTIQLLGIRLFNASASGLALMLAGYYQNSLTLLRDLLETGFLLHYFAIDRSKINEWTCSDETTRHKNFRPVMIRDALNKHDGATQRGHIYKLMCNYAAHPAYEGFTMVAPNGLGSIGPFLDEKRLKSLVEELAKHLLFFALVYMGHFDKLPPEFLKLKSEFLNNVKSWGERFLGVNLKDAKLEEINELIRCI
jgi:hypothetical protein